MCPEHIGWWCGVIRPRRSTPHLPNRGDERLMKGQRRQKCTHSLIGQAQGDSLALYCVISQESVWQKWYYSFSNLKQFNEPLKSKFDKEISPVVKKPCILWMSRCAGELCCGSLNTNSTPLKDLKPGLNHSYFLLNRKILDKNSFQVKLLHGPDFILYSNERHGFGLLFRAHEYWVPSTNHYSIYNRDAGDMFYIRLPWWMTHV